jgi:hypothetical protein
MKEDQAESWMKELAADGAIPPLPEFDRLWAMRRLEEEFERRRKIAAPLFWMDVALQGAAGLAAVVLLTWWGTLS